MLAQAQEIGKDFGGGLLLVKEFKVSMVCWKLLVFKPNLNSDYITSIVGKSVNMFSFRHESLP